mmetsp:Transcript_14472/g.35005  ORF Transcript_14472/g.35005 Transcript_14472/m.35005 type:complete len:408 (+) Transcript_14472:189-1412(+)
MLRVMSIASVAAGAVVLLVMLDGTSFAHPADLAPAELAAPRCSFADLYPRQLVAYKVERPPSIDGDLDEPAWDQVPWSAPFVDIRGTPPGPSPRFATAVKIRWDAAFLYIAARLQEPDVWANLTQHDSVIFHDNDFEVFVDPAGSAHFYKEFEVNARATTWALSLNKPYINGGYENSSRVFGAAGFDMPRAKAGVRVSTGAASIDDPAFASPARFWTVEIALPIFDLTLNNSLGVRGVRHGDLWRINFSRVEWRVKAVGDHYEKLPGPEDNWVWQPMGEVAMHLPERWGILQFSQDPVNDTIPQWDPSWTVRTLARLLYDAQELRKSTTGGFARTLAELRPFDTRGVLEGECSTPPVISTDTSRSWYSAKIVARGFQASIDQDRLLTVSKMPSSGNASSTEHQRFVK